MTIIEKRIKASESWAAATSDAADVILFLQLHREDLRQEAEATRIEELLEAYLKTQYEVIDIEAELSSLLLTIGLRGVESEQAAFLQLHDRVEQQIRWAAENGSRYLALAESFTRATGKELNHVEKVEEAVRNLKNITTPDEDFFDRGFAGIDDGAATEFAAGLTEPM
jgi:hypothetical protein